jgi:iron complex transport system substrate-binding protein
MRQMLGWVNFTTSLLQRFELKSRRFVLGLMLSVGVLIAAAGTNAGDAEESAPRLISLNPSLTAITLRLGSGEALVGVDEYSARLFDEVASLPRVGGLFDPALESVLALRPDRVLLVAGIDQQSHGQRLTRLGLEVEIFENERLDQVLENIARLGKILHREQAAAERIAAILGMRQAVADAVVGRRRPATLAVLDRSPLYLVGSDTFLDEMLESVGAQNLARGLSAGYPRGSIEWLIAAKPELLLDLTPGGEDSRAFWARWPSLPAVVAERVLTLDASRISLPGPELDRALRELAVAVHGVEIDAAIEAALSNAERLGAEPSGVRGP